MSNPILFPVRPKIGQGAGIGVGPLNPTVLLDETQSPFYQLDWPNPPQRKSYIIADVSSRPVNDATIAFNQLDWPNPQPRKRQNVGYINPALVNLPAGSPLTSFEFRNPDIPKKQPITWAQNLLQNTLTPIVVNTPVINVDYSEPIKKPYIIVSIATRIVEPGPVIPPSNVEFPNPAPKRRVGLTWVQDRKFYYQDIKPFNQTDYPNPPAKLLKIPNTWIFSRKIDEPQADYMPCSVLDWPNPAPKRKIALTWIGGISQFQQLFTQPNGNQFITPPPQGKKKEALTWLQQRPFYYLDAVQNPFSFNDWRVPSKKGITLIISHLQSFTSSAPPGNPFSQKDWPNPIHKQRLRIDWEFHYQQDDNQPRPTEWLALPPQPRKGQSLGYIFSPQIAGTGDPTRAFDYPNPIIVKRQTLTIINNLLPHLFPGVGATPFNQNEWPIPQKGRTNFHSGWIQQKPTYYTEPSIQVAQYDWPVFRSIRRHDVGFIFSQKQSENPRFTTLDFVPSRKKVINQDWIFSSLFDLTSIAGAIPFKQTEWPNPLRKRINYNIYTILRQLNIIPDVVGREICLRWEDTEYYLIAGEEDYDLEWKDTEYYLDSGGNDCE